ncbi:MAG: phosphodiester glycosidase family protein [Candidatus Sericytochromatia bacterium]
MKRRLFALMVSLLCFVCVTPAQAQSAPRVLLNNRLLGLNHTPFAQAGMIYLPVQVIEQMGVQVFVDPASRSVRLMRQGLFYQLREGSRLITWQGRGLQISHAPIWQEGTLFVPRTLFVNLGALLSYSSQNNEIRIVSELNQLQSVQVFPNAVYTRLVFQFQKAPAYRVQESDTALTIELSGMSFDEDENLQARVPAFQDPLLKQLRIEKTGTASLRIRIDKAYASPHKIFWLKEPERLMIDLAKIFQEDEQRSLAPGVHLTRSYQGFPFGPVKSFVVKVDPSARFQLEPVLAGTQTRGFVKEPVSRIAQRHKALVAVNGGYFHKDGPPLGTVMLNRELIASPFYNRTLLGFFPGQSLLIDQNDRSLALYLPEYKRSMALHAINLPRQNNQLVLYSSRYGLRTGTSQSPDALELQVLYDGTVQQVGTHNLPIPEDGWVISAHGQGAQALRELAHEGLRVLVYSRIWERWSQAQHLLAGGPRLLKGGQIQVTSEQERFQPDIAQGRAPRTALGMGPKGELWLVVVDGRQQNSRGLTLTELAQLLKEKGAVEAINFDGGGSSALAINGQVVNQPSDGQERAVTTALILKPRP